MPRSLRWRIFSERASPIIARAAGATLTVVRPFGGLKPGEAFSFKGDASVHQLWPAVLELTGAEVVAEDEHGCPALVIRRDSAGLAALCSVPFEAMLGTSPNAFEGDNPAWRIYEAVASEARALTRMRTGLPSVEAGSLVGRERGYTVVVNHSATEETVTLEGSQPVRRMSRLGQRGAEELKPTRGSWHSSVPAWEGVVVAWEH